MSPVALIDKIKTKFNKNSEQEEIKISELQSKAEVIIRKRVENSSYSPTKEENKILREWCKEFTRQKNKEAVELSKRQAWAPAQYEYDYNLKVKAAKEDEKLSPEQIENKIEEAKKELKEKNDKFADPTDRVKKIKAQYKNADKLFTKTERISIYNYKLNNNTLILGGSGAGKTRYYAMPNILQANASFVVTDPKGEILEKSGHFLRDVMGYKIKVLDLMNMKNSDLYNPFEYIKPLDKKMKDGKPVLDENGEPIIEEREEGYEERVLSLIETIIVNTNGEEKKGGPDPFWDNAERLFLQSLFFFTVDGFPPEERNINTTLDLMRKLQIAEEDDKMDSDLDHFVDIFAEIHSEKHIGVQQYREFRSKASGKTAKSIVITASARFAPFRIKNTGDMMKVDNMELNKVGEEKTALFVIVPPTNQTFNFVAGILFTQLFQELEYCATQKNKHNGQRLPIPVQFILDEYANTCKIPRIVNFLAYARSFGVGITIIIQSLEQIKNMHEKEWGVVVDNCNTLLYLGKIQHMETLEYMSKLIGKATFDKRTHGTSRSNQTSSSINEDVVGRELMMPDDIRRMPDKDCLFVVSGRPVFYSEKYDYSAHPNYRYTSDANRENSFKYKPEDEATVLSKKAVIKGLPKTDASETENQQSYHRDEKPLDMEEVENLSNVEASKMFVENDVQTVAGILVENKEYAFADNNELAVDDGSLEQQNEEILEEFTFDSVLSSAKEEKAKNKKTASEIFEERKNELTEKIIFIENDMVVVGEVIGRCHRDELAFVDNEEIKVDDGSNEEFIATEIVPEIESFTFEDTGENTDVLFDDDMSSLGQYDIGDISFD